VPRGQRDGSLGSILGFLDRNFFSVSTIILHAAINKSMQISHVTFGLSKSRAIILM
jgi:hypothetical protein